MSEVASIKLDMLCIRMSSVGIPIPELSCVELFLVNIGISFDVWLMTSQA